MMEYESTEWTPQSVENLHNNDSFNSFFKELKRYVKFKKVPKHWKSKGMAQEIIKQTNKKDIIIFKVNPKKLNEIEFNKNKRTIFPFDNVFLEHPIIFNFDDGKAFCSGIFFRRQMDMVVCTLVWVIFFENYLDNAIVRISHMGFKEKDIYGLNETNVKKSSEDGINFGGMTCKKVFIIIKKFISAIEKKEYTTYKKWNPSGFTEKEIIYAHDVRTHIRHFWKDSGRFKIPYMSKEELINKDYGIHEIVFKDGGLRKDVPYKIIGTYLVGKEKLKKEENREIILLEKKLFKQEEKLGKILRQIFPNEIIKHNKTFFKNSYLRLDWNIWKKRLAFEYDGEQHFDKQLYKKLYGDGFEEQKTRDRLKDKLCKKKNITLIRIKYSEPLTKTYIKKRIKNEI